MIGLYYSDQNYLHLFAQYCNYQLMIDCAFLAILILYGLFSIASATQAYKKAKDTTPVDSQPEFPPTV